MTLSRHAGRTHRSGMTLIELLFALAIASLVIMLVFSVYHTVSMTRLGQEGRLGRDNDVADAVLQISRDLTCTFAHASDEMCAFTLLQDEQTPPSAQLLFCSAVMTTGETNLFWFELHRVAYRIGMGEKNSSVLFREHQPLTGPGAFAPPRTNVLGTDVESFRVSVYDGSEWRNEWGTTGNAPCPRAARIEMTARYGFGTKTFQTEVLIPAGHSISSTITRTTL